MTVYTNARVTAIGDEGVITEIRGRRQVIPADHVFVATGMKPNRSLYDQLLEKGVQTFNVGDSAVTGKIYDAIHSGYKAGLKV